MADDKQPAKGGRKSADTDRASGVIARIEPSERGSKDTKRSWKLTLNTDVVWRDFVRDQATDPARAARTGPGKAAEKGGEAAAKGESPVKGALKGGLTGIKDKAKNALGGGGGGGGGKATKATKIIESIDVGVPISVAYNQWTQFQDFSDFMKKVDNVEQKDEEKLEFKAQVFWSHRKWEATILEQVPDERIVWRSTGEKGHVDGGVTFHELAPNLTRILMPDDWEGFPQRKDYPLGGVPVEYKGAEIPPPDQRRVYQ